MVAVPLESLPLGFRFHPTDEELVNHYLKGKIGGRKPQVDLVIPEIDVCKCEPWDLPDKSIIKTGDPEWFFFAPRDRKYPNGHRSNRATEAGYWKATGKDRKIKSRALAGSALIGMKKTLVFYRGRAPKGERTGWIMHEYRTVDGNTDGATGDQGAYVLCRLFKKQEEKPLNSNYDEIDETAFSPLQSKSSPDETPVVPEQENESEKEIVQEVKMQDMQESKQLSSTEEQPDVSSWLTDGVDTGIYPAKPEDSYSNSNMASDVVGLEIELRKMHEDDICWPPEQVDSANYPLPLSPMPLVESHVYGNFNHQIELLPGDNTEPDYIAEFLDSVLSNQDENLGNSVDQKDFNGDAFIDKQVDVYASDVPQSYQLLGNVDNMLLTNNLENDERLCQAQADLGSNPPICQNSDYPMDSVHHLQAGAAFYTKASIDVYSPDSLQELSGIPEMAIMSNADNTSYGNTENSLVGAEIQIKHGQRQHVSSSSSNRQGIAVRRIRLQKELHVGSSLCSVSSSTTESYRNQANPVVKPKMQRTCMLIIYDLLPSYIKQKLNVQVKKDEQVLKPEESTGSANVDEMGSSDHDEGLSAEKTPNSKEVIESMPASTPRKSGSDSQHKDIAVPQTVDQKFTAAKDEGLSAERSPDSKEAVIESMPTLRLRKSNSVLQHKVVEVTETADQKLKYAKRHSLLTYMALGAVVAASIIGISVYFRL